LASAATDLVEEVLEEDVAQRGVADFGMELKSIEWLAAMLNRGDGAGRGGSQGNEHAAGIDDLVAMAHPNRSFCRHP